MLPRMSVDPARPGVILFDDIPMALIPASINAKEIVRAYNAYDDLVEALSELCEHLAPVDQDMRLQFLFDRATSILAKARGEE